MMEIVNTRMKVSFLLWKTFKWSQIQEPLLGATISNHYLGAIIKSHYQEPLLRPLLGINI